MKSHRILIASFVLGLASVAPVALIAQDPPASPAKTEQKASAPEWAELFGDASLPVVWQSASAASEKIAAALGAKKLDGVADWAETIHLAAHALEDQVKIDDAEKAKRLKGALEQAAKIADDVLDGANHQEPDQTAAAYRRLASALTLVKSRLPKDIVDAPPQEVRFAKAASHDESDHGHKH